MNTLKYGLEVRAWRQPWMDGVELMIVDWGVESGDIQTKSICTNIEFTKLTEKNAGMRLEPKITCTSTGRNC